MYKRYPVLPRFIIGWVLFLLLSLPGAKGYAQKGCDQGILPADAMPEKYLSLLQHKRVGLIINQTSFIGNLSLLDLLISKGVRVTAIFVPEHGFRGREDAGSHVNNSRDSVTHIPIISLYGKHKKPQPEDLADVDVMIYDLQDVGVRFYTYISTLQYCMQACAQNHKQLIVLDRPDPNGFYIDGPVLEKDCSSFVGMQPVPVVYAMTPGEYAKMLLGEGWTDSTSGLNMEVIPCSGYTHKMSYCLPVAPSPNLRNMAAVYAYPSLCLFEGTPVSVGRGTSLPFQQYGCPEFEGKYLYSFIPATGEGAKKPPYEGKVCYGACAGVEANDVRETIENKINVTWLLQAYTDYPQKENFFTSFFTSLAGTPKLAAQIKNGLTEKEIRTSWEQDILVFKRIRKKYLLYEDFEK